MDESEYDSDNADMDIDSVTTAAEPKIEKKSKIKSDWIESLALPRLVSDERESPARVKARDIIYFFAFKSFWKKRKNISF